MKLKIGMQENFKKVFTVDEVNAIAEMKRDNFKEINEKCDYGVRDATEEEYFCIQDLIWQYSQSGKPCYIYG